MKDKNNIINFIEANNKLWHKQNEEALQRRINLTVSLTILKIQTINNTDEDTPQYRSEDIPYDMHQINKAIYKANEYLIKTYSDDELNKLTSLPDVLSSLAVEYLIGYKPIELQNIEKNTREE